MYIHVCRPIFDFNFNKVIIFLLVERDSSLERTIQKIIQIGLAPHKGQQENKYYGIVQEGQREGTKE